MKKNDNIEENNEFDKEELKDELMDELKDEIKEEIKHDKVRNAASNFFTTVLVGLLIITAAVGGWVVGASNAVEVTFGNNKKYNSENITNSSGNSSNDDLNNNYNNEQVPEEAKEKELDLSRSLNTTGLRYSDASDIGEAIGLKINTDSSTKVSIDWNKFGPYSGATAWSDTTTELDIRNLSGSVSSGFVGGEGQDAIGTILFYLMDDGTVEYTNVFVKQTDNSGNQYYSVNYSLDRNSDGRVTNQYFSSQGKINGVSNVIKIYTAQVRDGMSGYFTTIGATADGSFYDLGYAIRN